MKKLIVRDEHSRDIIRIGPRGRMAVARYPDMNDKIKDYICGIYVKTTGKDKQGIIDFLNYIGEENEFCS